MQISESKQTLFVDAHANVNLSGRRFVHIKENMKGIAERNVEMLVLC